MPGHRGLHPAPKIGHSDPYWQERCGWQRKLKSHVGPAVGLGEPSVMERVAESSRELNEIWLIPSGVAALRWRAETFP
jgi:hypothetical protein